MESGLFFLKRKFMRTQTAKTKKKDKLGSVIKHY